jgi:hypothetical protein
MKPLQKKVSFREYAWCDPHRAMSLVYVILLAPIDDTMMLMMPVVMIPIQ